MTDTGEGAESKPPGTTEANWRSVRQLDAEAWKKLQDGAPLRALRWAAAVALVSLMWWLSGDPHSAVAWLPALVLVALLLLPDADSLGFGSFTYKTRKDADRAEAAGKKAERVAGDIQSGREVGEAQGGAAQARGTPQPPADEVRKYLGL